MNYLDFYKEQYYKEIDRSIGISNSFASPIAIMSIMAGGMYYSIDSYHLLSTRYFQWLFIAIMLLTFCLLIKSLYHLIKAISNFKTGYDYYLIPNAEELHQFNDALENRKNTDHSILKPPSVKIQNVSRDPKKEIKQIEEGNNDAEITFDKYILDILVKCITKNQLNNDIKLYQRFLCIRYLSFAIVSISLALIPLANKKPKPETKKIENILPQNQNNMI